MRSRRASVLAAALGCALAACAPAIEVQTAARPETDWRPYRSFSILVPPPPRDGRTLDRDDPMLVNSRSNRELRNAVVAGLWGRGYWLDERSPDLLVAYYATARQPLDLTQWSYGYGTRPRWWQGCEPPLGSVASEFRAGTVIIDVLDVRNGEVVWRGCGVAEHVDDVAAYQHDLGETVRVILAEFPLAASVVAQAARIGPVRNAFKVSSGGSR